VRVYIDPGGTKYGENSTQAGAQIDAHVDSCMPISAIVTVFKSRGSVELTNSGPECSKQICLRSSRHKLQLFKS